MVAVLSAYLNGSPIPPENPRPEPNNSDYRFEAIIDDRKRPQVVFRENSLPNGRTKNPYGPNGFGLSDRFGGRGRDYQSRRSGSY